MRSARLDLRVAPDLKARVEAAAAERGQTLTVFAERALETALGDSSTAEQPRGREPISQTAGSTPAAPASSRTSAKATARQDLRRGVDMQAAALERQRAMNKAKGL